MKKPTAVQAFKLGAKVKWNWMGHAVCGQVEKVYTTRVSKTFRETVFARNGTPEKPAYVIKSEAGNRVVKSHTELYRN